MVFVKKKSVNTNLLTFSDKVLNSLGPHTQVDCIQGGPHFNCLYRDLVNHKRYTFT